MFTNPLNRKYESGGSVPNKANSLVEKASKNSGVSVKELTDKMNEFSSDEAKGGAFAELIKSAASDKDSQERREAVASLKAMFKKSTKFADRGKFQDFVCKHGRGGNVDCGCGGMKVVRGQGGIDKLPEGTSRVITSRDTTDIYKLPNGNIVESVHPTDGSEPRYTEYDQIHLVAPTYSSNPKLRNAIGVLAGLWPWAARKITPEQQEQYEEARRATFGTQTKENGGVVMGQDGLITSLIPSEKNNRANRWTRREALDVAQAGNEDNPDRATLRKVYRGLKREGLENGLGWRARRDDARRRLVGGYNLNGEFQSSPAELTLPEISGPRKYNEGVTSTGNLSIVDVDAGTPIQKKPVVKTITGPSVTESLAAKKAFNDAWMQYQYERGIYNNRTGAYTAGQDGQAYMNWLYGDFKKNYDPTTGKMNSNWYWRQPTNEELKMYENTPYYGAVLPGSAQARKEYGIDLDNYRFLTPETMLVQTDPYELSAEQRRDVAKYPTTIGPGSNDIHGNVGKLMGAIIAGGYGANLANQLIAEIPELTNGINTNDEALMSKVNRWIENNWKSLDGTKMKRPAYGNQKRNALGQFGNRSQGSWYYRGNRRIAGSEIGFKQGGQIEKHQQENGVGRGKLNEYYPANETGQFGERVENLYTPDRNHLILITEPGKVSERRDSSFVFISPNSKSGNPAISRRYKTFDKFTDKGPFEGMRNLWENWKLHANKNK